MFSHLFSKLNVGTAYVLGCLSLQAVHSSNKWKKRVRSFCFLLVCLTASLSTVQAWSPGARVASWRERDYNESLSVLCWQRRGFGNRGPPHVLRDFSFKEFAVLGVSLIFFHFHTIFISDAWSSVCSCKMNCPLKVDFWSQIPNNWFSSDVWKLEIAFIFYNLKYSFRKYIHVSWESTEACSSLQPYFHFGKTWERKKII